MRLGVRALAKALTAEGNRISAAGITRATQSGRLPRGEDGLYDLDEARKQLAANTNAAKSRAGRAQQKSTAADQSEPVPRKRKPAETLNEAQTRKEIALANLREKEDREKDRTLIETEVVHTHWSDIGVRLQNAIMGMPARLVNRLPAEWRREVLSVAQDEARAILTALSDEIRRADPQAA